MSDYIYMLESHLGPQQNGIVAQVQSVAAQANISLFLAGGAMRDMLGGFRIRDLDFAVIGDALAFAEAVCKATGSRQVSVDKERKIVELVFPDGSTAQIASTRATRRTTASKAAPAAATIQEDLRSRDFTCNAIALSLSKASRGLLLDPLNGLADIERRELRSVTPSVFYDDPVRLLRLARLRARLGFVVEERTRQQASSAHEAGVEKSIPARSLGEELKQISAEESPSEVLKALEEAGLLTLFSAALTGAKLNLPGILKFERSCQLLPQDALSVAARFPVFLSVLTEKLTPRERQGLIKTLDLRKEDVIRWQKLEARAKKLESALRSARIRKPSHVYQIVSAAEPDEALLLLQRSALRPVQDRLRSYYQKYLPAIQEITPEEWASVEGKPGTPRHQKARQEFIARRLDRRPPKPPAAPDVPATPANPAPPAGPRQWRAPQAAAARRARTAY